MAGRLQSVLGAHFEANTSLSSEIDLGGSTLIALEIPASFNGTTLTFQARAQSTVTEVTDQETFKEVYDDSGTAISVTVAQNRIVVLTSSDSLAFAPLRHIKIRSGTAASPVDQQECFIKVIVKE